MNALVVEITNIVFVCFKILLLTSTIVHAKPVPSLYDTYKCLDQDWVQMMRSRIKNPDEKDEFGRTIHFLIREGWSKPVFKMDTDPRLKQPNLFHDKCEEPGVFMGKGCTVDSVTGKVINPGSYKDSIVLEFNYWDTHMLNDWIATIFIEEILGYEVSHFELSGNLYSAQRMSSVRRGKCTPVHVNMEVWLSGKVGQYEPYTNESYDTGLNGIQGRSGVFVPSQFVKQAENSTYNPALNFTQTFYANFWKGYRDRPELIRSLKMSDLVASSFYPPSSTTCANGTMGCLNHCSKSAACSAYEKDGKECMVTVLAAATWDPGFFQAAMANNGIPSYFCFLGWGGMTNYVRFAIKNQKPVIFYAWQPDRFFFEIKNQFMRVFLPETNNSQMSKATGTFGELGYGKPSTNPVASDFPSQFVRKYASNQILKNKNLVEFMSKYYIPPLSMDGMLYNLTQWEKTNKSGGALKYYNYYKATCTWIRHNYDTWKSWFSIPPVCTFGHLKYIVNGCNDTIRNARNISFQWKVKHVLNSSISGECDGGISLPEPILTHHTCDWINTYTFEWTKWIEQKPECSKVFYKYKVSNCHSDGYRRISFAWKFPMKNNPQLAINCIQGDTLPKTKLLVCDYMPTSSGVYIFFAIMCCAGTAATVAMIIYVIIKRKHPVFVRTQYPLLLVLLVGVLLMFLTPIALGGQPGTLICGLRPILMTTGFSLIFCSLLVKSLRVLYVFSTNRKLKKVTIPISVPMKQIAIMLLIEYGIIFCWYILDYPQSRFDYVVEEPGIGPINHEICKSNGFIFQVLSYFYKGLLLMAGTYTSFKIRTVASDFQESLYVFISVAVTTISSTLALPLTYTNFDAPSKYLFQAGAIFTCTCIIFGCMLIPKLIKIRQAGSRQSILQTEGTTKTIAVASRKYACPEVNITDTTDTAVTSNG